MYIHYRHKNDWLLIIQLYVFFKWSVLSGEVLELLKFSIWSVEKEVKGLNIYKAMNVYYLLLLCLKSGHTRQPTHRNNHCNIDKLIRSIFNRIYLLIKQYYWINQYWFCFIFLQYCL